MTEDGNPIDEKPADLQALRTALTGLAGLVAGEDSLEHLLAEVATFAMVAIPGADGAGVTVLDPGAPDTIVGSAPFVRDVDRIQYRLGEGPCISAAADGRTVSSGALGQDGSWPEFGPQAADLDVHSALSLPLKLHGNVLGSLNVYAHSRDAFSSASQRMGEHFAGPAAVAIHNARLLDHLHRQAARLESALTSRSTIDQAIGILMSRSGITREEAFVRLRIISQHDHIKLNLVAEKLVDQAVRRARAHHSDAGH